MNNPLLDMMGIAVGTKQIAGWEPGATEREKLLSLLYILILRRTREYAQQKIREGMPEAMKATRSYYRNRTRHD